LFDKCHGHSVFLKVTMQFNYESSWHPNRSFAHIHLVTFNLNFPPFYKSCALIKAIKMCFPWCL